MRIGLVIYGSLDTLSGGYLYDRKLVGYLQSRGDTVEVTSLPWRNYAVHLTDNVHVKLPKRVDILIEDELNHPSLVWANRGKHPYPIVSLVHHLRCSELRPAWQNTFYRWIEKKYLNSVDAFIFNSRTTKNVVEGLVGRTKPCIVAHPPTDRFGEPLSEQEIVDRARRHPFRILFLGNVTVRKGLHTLLSAVRILPFEFRLDVIGSLTTEPEYARQIQRVTSDQELAGRVFFHGSLSREPLIESLKQAHVLVVPSSYEGFGIVYLEGMCFGLPAVGTTAGAAGEIIEPGRTGYLIAPGDSRSLRAHLCSLAGDRERLVRLSLRARQRYLRQPSWRETAGNIRQFLHDLRDGFDFTDRELSRS